VRGGVRVGKEKPPGHYNQGASQPKPTERRDDQPEERTLAPLRACSKLGRSFPLNAIAGFFPVTTERVAVGGVQKTLDEVPPRVRTTSTPIGLINRATAYGKAFFRASTVQNDHGALPSTASNLLKVKILEATLDLENHLFLRKFALVETLVAVLVVPTDQSFFMVVWLSC
jgi:hypothetical protein